MASAIQRSRDAESEVAFCCWSGSTPAILVGPIRFVNRVLIPSDSDQFRQNLAGFAKERIIGEGTKRRWISVDFNYNRAAIFRAPPQVGRRINNARSPD